MINHYTSLQRRAVGLVFVLCTLAWLAPAPAAQTAEKPAEPNPARDARLQSWREARFGMFIHWGPVSIKGTEIGWSRGDQVPQKEYDNLYTQFNPTQFNADEWVKLAKDAGMKYMVFTSKHHDGFCNWDTKQTDYNIMKSPFGRDTIKELAAACKKQDLAFGTYYSVCDWHHPDFPLGSPGGRSRKPEPNLDRYNEYLKAQVKELITNYGPLCTMWFDVPQQFDRKRGLALEEFTRSLQPDIIINNRSGASGDYDTPEQRVGGFRIDRPWETCMTICHQWAWKPNDQMKSLKQCIQTLVSCAGGDGNLLFNVGPMPDGRIEQRQIDRLHEMGVWIKANGASIYATRGGPYKPTRALASTRRDQTVFLHIMEWPGDEIKLPALSKKVVKAELLNGREAKVQQTNEGLTVSVAPADRDEIDTVVKLTLDGPAMEIAPIQIATPGK